MLKFFISELHHLDEIDYCINCTDLSSQSCGTFAYDKELFYMGFGLWAISPVFDSVDEFYAWAKCKGFRYHCLKANFVMRRQFPTK